MSDALFFILIGAACVAAVAGFVLLLVWPVKDKK